MEVQCHSTSFAAMQLKYMTEWPSISILDCHTAKYPFSASPLL